MSQNVIEIPEDEFRALIERLDELKEENETLRQLKDWTDKEIDDYNKDFADGE